MNLTKNWLGICQTWPKTGWAFAHPAHPVPLPLHTHAQQSGKEEKTKEAEKNKKKYAGVFFYVFFYAKGDPGGTTYSRQKTAGSLHSLSLQHYGQNVKISSKN